MQGTNVVAGLLTLALTGSIVAASQARSKIEFEAASLRSSSPLLPKQEKPINGVRSGGPGTADPGQLTYSRVPLDQILADAFDLSWDRIAGPRWMITERYDIVAKIRQGSTPDEALLMLQNLLMERLRLSFHAQTRVLPGYELVVATAGSKLQESAMRVPTPWRPAQTTGLYPKDTDGFPILPPGVRQGVAPAPGHVRAKFRDTALSEFAQYLGSRLGTQFVPGPVPGIKRITPAAILDKTGLTERYDFTFDHVGFPAPASKNPASMLSAMQSALDKQLGLKLVEAKVPVDILVIDHIERTPAEN
jgi:uncharacterized protein (TIGR03435 family)